MSTTRPLPRPSLFPEFDLLRLAESPAWHDSAPRRVRTADGWSHESRGWRAWRKHLRDRRRPRPLGELLPNVPRPLAPWTWGLADAADAGGALELLVLLDRVVRGKRVEPEALEAELRERLHDQPVELPRLFDALELTGWARALPGLTSLLPAGRWWELLTHLLQVVNAAKLAPAPSDPRVELLLLGELPLSLAHGLPELWPCRALAGEARGVIGESWDQLLDASGQPRASQQLHLRPLLASWTRSWLLGREIDVSFWPEGAAERLARAWQAAWRLTRRDGSQVLLAEPAVLGPTVERRQGRWLQVATAALRLDDAMCPSGNANGARARRKPSAGSNSGRRLPAWVTGAPAASHSSWGQSAVLKTDWGRRSLTLALDYHNPTLRLELCSAGVPILAGPWDVEVRRGDEVLRVSEPWVSTCWESDDDVDYLELEADLSPAVRLQRQFLLARQDRWLLLFDSVLADGESSDAESAAAQRPLIYTGRIPLAVGTQSAPAADTREVDLTADRWLGRVFPLSLSEWRRERRQGDFEAQERGLHLTQISAGPALAAAWWIDLDRRRRAEPYTWRRLTVGQERRVLGPEQAVAARVQVGDRHWLVYRALDGVHNRTVLGKNLVSEFFAGRFLPHRGETEPLIELEPTRE